MAKCGACGKFISQTDSVKCQKCYGIYHKLCVNLPGVGVVHSSWRCPECTKNIVRDNKADTPIRGRPHHVSSPSEEEVHDPDCGAPKSTPVEQVPSELVTNLKLLNEELCSVRKELQLFREDMTELRSSLIRCTERMDSLEARVVALEQHKVGSVSDVIAELKQELNERDQELLANDVQISNVPESAGENPLHLVGQIANKLGVTIDERDIVSAVRAGARRAIATSGEDAERRPRPLVVRLSRRRLRDELLQSARVRRGATTEGLDMPAPVRRFYVNERLTKFKRQLFRMARDSAKRTGWKFVWTKHGTILARKEPGEACCYIRTEADIQRYFGAAI